MQQVFSNIHSLKTPEDLIAHVENDVNTIVKKTVNINGRNLVPIRVSSDPRIFDVTIDKDNVWGINNPGDSRGALMGIGFSLNLCRRVFTSSILKVHVNSED